MVNTPLENALQNYIQSYIDEQPEFVRVAERSYVKKDAVIYPRLRATPFYSYYSNISAGKLEENKAIFFELIGVTSDGQKKLIEKHLTQMIHSAFERGRTRGVSVINMDRDRECYVYYYSPSLTAITLNNLMSPFLYAPKRQWLTSPERKMELLMCLILPIPFAIMGALYLTVMAQPHTFLVAIIFLSFAALSLALFATLSATMCTMGELEYLRDKDVFASNQSTFDWKTTKQIVEKDSTQEKQVEKPSFSELISASPVERSQFENAIGFFSESKHNDYTKRQPVIEVGKEGTVETITFQQVPSGNGGC